MRPSGDHDGSDRYDWSPNPVVVSHSGFTPSVSVIYISARPNLPDVYAIRRPSGEKLGDALPEHGDHLDRSKMASVRV